MKHTNHLLVSCIISASASSIAVAQGDNPYISAGMPAASRPWTDMDYMTAAQILSSKKVPLPRYSTSFGSELLKRMTDRDNFLHLKNKNLGLQSRVMAMGRINRALDTIFGLYREENKSIPCFAERASLTCLTIYWAANTIGIIEDMETSIPNDENKQKNQELVNALYAQQTSGLAMGESVISYNVFPDPKHNSAILLAMSDTLPIALPHLKPDYKQEMSLKLEKLRTRFGNTADLNVINKIIASLQP